MRTNQNLEQSSETDEEREEAALEVKVCNREVMALLGTGAHRPSQLVKWKQDLDKRIFRSGGQATPEQECELACIKATTHLARKKGSRLPIECGYGWRADAGPATVALEVCLRSLKNFDPKKGELAGYLYRIAEREVRKTAWEMFGTGKNMGFTGRGKDSVPVLVSRDAIAAIRNSDGEPIESRIEYALSTIDLVSCEMAPQEIESASDLEIVRKDLAQVAPSAPVISVGQETINAKLDLQLSNVSPEKQSLLKRWFGVTDTADGEIMEELAINCLAAEYGISVEGMRKRLMRILREAGPGSSAPGVQLP